MTINENIKIIAMDKNNVVICEKYIPQEGKKKGEILWNPVAYCSNMKSALKILVDREVNGTELEELKMIVNKIDELKEIIESRGM